MSYETVSSSAALHATWGKKWPWYVWHSILTNLESFLVGKQGCGEGRNKKGLSSWKEWPIMKQHSGRDRQVQVGGGGGRRRGGTSLRVLWGRKGSAGQME